MTSVLMIDIQQLENDISVDCPPVHFPNIIHTVSYLFTPLYPLKESPNSIYNHFSPHIFTPAISLLSLGLQHSGAERIHINTIIHLYKNKSLPFVCLFCQLIVHCPSWQLNRPMASQTKLSKQSSDFQIDFLLHSL